MSCSSDDEHGATHVMNPPLSPPIPRPVLRKIEKPPRGGRPRTGKHCFGSEGESSTSCSAFGFSDVESPLGSASSSKTLRPLPPIPNFHAPPNATSPTCSELYTPSTARSPVRPLPPTPARASSCPGRTSNRSDEPLSALTLSPTSPASEPSFPHSSLPFTDLAAPQPSQAVRVEPKRAFLAPQPLPVHPLHITKNPCHPILRRSPAQRTPSPRPPPLPLEAYVLTPSMEAGVLDITDRNDLLEAMMKNPDRHHELILLASSLSRLALSPDTARDSEDPDLTPKASRIMTARPNTVFALPKLALTVPGDKKKRRLVVDDDEDAIEKIDYNKDGGRDEEVISSPIEFLNELAPSKRQTVISIIHTLVEEDLGSSDSEEDDEEYYSDYDEEEVSGEIKSKAAEVSWEFEVRTGRAISAPALIRRFTRIWEREENGERVVEDDYRNVLSFLRRL